MVDVAKSVEVVDKPKPKRGVLWKRLWKLASPELGHIALGLSALGVNAFTNMSYPTLLGRAVDHFSNENTADSNFIPYASGIIAAGTVASWVRVYCLGVSKDRLSSRLRQLLFNSLVSKDISYFDANKTGELLTVLEDDVDKAAEAVTDNVFAGLRSINSAFVGSIYLFYKNARLSIVTLCIVPVVGVSAMALRKFVSYVQEKSRLMKSDIKNYAIERFSCMSTVKLNSREYTEMEKFSEYNSECLELSSGGHMANGMFNAFLNVATNVSLGGVLLFGGRMLASGEMTSGDLTAFVSRAVFVTLGFSGLSSAYGDLNRSLDAANRIFEIIDDADSMKRLEIENQKDATTISKAATTNSSRGELILKNVSFSYPSSPDKIVLSSFSMHAASGSITAITGPSGSGKSTILKLISGLYTPSAGEILLDGVCIVTTPQHMHVGVVEQTPNLFSGTIHDTIAYGLHENSDSNPDIVRDRVISAAKLSAAHTFISSLPDGYETQVGVRGTRLSGGEQARIAVARALIKNPRMIILDEVTAGLDTINELELIKIMKNIASGEQGVKCSVVFFTHSPKVIDAAANVITLA